MMRRTTRHGFWRLAGVLAAIFALAPAPAGAAEKFTSDFLLENCTWSAWGRENPYFSLRPGRQLVLEGEEDGAVIRNEITVLRQLEPISFVTTRGVPITLKARVVEEREFEDGEIIEVSRNWFARCVETSDVYYFGEEVDIYEDGQIVDHHGAWRAGEDGAQPGIIIPATFLLGARYFQEIAPGVAEDRAENVNVGLTVTVPAGTFGNCVEVEESSPLQRGKDSKTYCPVIGLVKDAVQRLVEHGVVP